MLVTGSLRLTLELDKWAPNIGPFRRILGTLHGTYRVYGENSRNVRIPGSGPYYDKGPMVSTLDSKLGFRVLGYPNTNKLVSMEGLRFRGQMTATGTVLIPSRAILMG